MAKKPKSSWTHILALINDGYNNSAEAVVEALEDKIDTLAAKSNQQSDTIKSLKTVLEEVIYTLEKNDLKLLVGDVSAGDEHLIFDSVNGALKLIALS